MAAKNKTQKILDAAGNFVTARKGKWDHTAWEAFTTEIAELGIELNDESRRNLGNILEATKYFYQVAPTSKKKVASKAKPKSKAKAKSKAAPKKNA